MSENTNRTPRNNNQRKMYDYETDSYIPARSSKQPSLESRPKPQPKPQPRTSSRPQTQSSLQPQRRVTTGQHSGQQSRQQPMQPRPRTTTSSKLNGFKPPVVNGTRKSHNGEPFNKNEKTFAKTKHNQPAKAPKKRGLAVGTLLIAGLVTLTMALAPNISQDSTALTDPNKPSVSVNATHDYGDKNQTRPQQNKITSLNQINPKYEVITWKGEKQLTIDEESFRQIIQLALDDAKDFYYDELGAPTTKLVYDASQDKMVNAQGKENFYDEVVFNVDNYVARAKIESGDCLMVTFVNDIGQGKNNPSGIFQLMNDSVSSTLEEYFANVFGKKVNLDMEIVPSAQDVQNVETSAEAKQRISKAVYNSTLITVLKDIYQFKSMTKGHEECYLPYAKYTPEQITNKYNLPPETRDVVKQICSELKQTNGKYSSTLATCGGIAMHFYGFGDVRSSMENGTYYENYFTSDYVIKTIQKLKQIENEKGTNFFQDEGHQPQ